MNKDHFEKRSDAVKEGIEHSKHYIKIFKEQISELAEKIDKKVQDLEKYEKVLQKLKSEK